MRSESRATSGDGRRHGGPPLSSLLVSRVTGARGGGLAGPVRPQIPDELRANLDEARRLFREPEVADTTTLELKYAEPNEDG